MHIKSLWPLLLVLLGGCGYGIFGKKTTGAVNTLDKNVVASLTHIQDTALGTINGAKKDILDFLKFNSEKEAHDISVGLLKGTIGYLDDPYNREQLGLLLESIISHSGSAARTELVAFKNQLLGPESAGQVQALLQGVMKELVLNPAKNLLNLGLNPTTQLELKNLLMMVIPAVINDSAIGQIGKLRNVLLGANLKKDIASWVDTALVVANYRLDSTLRPTIKKIVKENSNTISKGAAWIIAGLVLLAIVIGAVIYFVQHKKVVLNQQMLAQVALKIEDMKDTDPQKYDDLTRNIQNAMRNQLLEPDMNRFLKERHIS